MTKPARNDEDNIDPVIKSEGEPTTKALVQISSNLKFTKLSIWPSILSKMKTYRSSAGSMTNALIKRNKILIFTNYFSQKVKANCSNSS